MKRLLTFAAALVCAGAMAQNNGAITQEMLSTIRQGWQGTAADKAIRNALYAAAIRMEGQGNYD